MAPLLLEKGNKSNGKTFPKGTFVGAEAFLHNDALEMLARAFAKGASLTPHSWCFSFDSLLQYFVVVVVTINAERVVVAGDSSSRLESKKRKLPPAAFRAAGELP